jgi:hypothetical protein
MNSILFYPQDELYNRNSLRIQLLCDLIFFKLTK